MNYEQRLKNLNDSQREVMKPENLYGPVMVIAGPGTGKTEILGMRVATILHTTDTNPENILCLTFTDNGVIEMRQRLVEILGNDGYKVKIHTFHSFGGEIMSEYPELFFQGANFTHADDLFRFETLKNILSNLPANHPLGLNYDDSFTFQKAVGGAITNFKDAGLSPAELRDIIALDTPRAKQIEELIVPILDKYKTMVKATVSDIQATLAELKTIEIPTMPVDEISSIVTVFIETLETALEAVEMTGKTTPITAWKNKWFEKNRLGSYRLKSLERFSKLSKVVDVYESYLQALQKAHRFDYSDMIVRAIHELENSDELRFSLQEKYQFILVDEFQDTNLSQLRIIRNLGDNPVNEGRPNIFIVGDPNQSIFSFQGAEISNIRKFKEYYPSAKPIVLDTNYRSTQEIINDAKQVIDKSADSLYTYFPELEQNLKSFKGIGISPNAVELTSLDEERDWVATKIEQLIDEGTPANQIAVITRKHDDLMSLVPYLNYRHIPVSYERASDILLLEPIQALNKLIRLIVLLADSRFNEANALMPEVLSHPSFGFSSEDIWQLSLESYKNNYQLWLETMDNLPVFADFKTWLIEMVRLSRTERLDEMIDRLIGVPDKYDIQLTNNLFDYYFSEKALTKNPNDYYLYVRSLRTLRNAMRDYNSNENLKLKDYVKFSDLYQQIGNDFILNTEVGNEATSVRLMTAHKSKGSQFEHVFIINADERTWRHTNGNNSSISYPENLVELKKDGSADEVLRLMYVAMTRAKTHLTFTFSKLDENGGDNILTGILPNYPPEEVAANPNPKHLEIINQIDWSPRLLEPRSELSDFLKPILDRYRLSASALTSFIDLKYAGPTDFITHNLLSFPSATSNTMTYGTVIHKTLEILHNGFNLGESVDIDKAMTIFDEVISTKRFGDDFEHYRDKGHQELSKYLEDMAVFKTSQKSELSFTNQTVQFENIRLTGKVDLADIDSESKTITVTDYKTSERAKDRWEASSVSHLKYRYQLMFYKLLLENSADWHNYTVTSGTIDYIGFTKDGDCSRLPSVDFTDKEYDRFKQLVKAVWQRITEFNIPDVSQYGNTVRDIERFVDDLIAGTV